MPKIDMRTIAAVLMLSALSLGGSAVANPSWSCLFTGNMGQEVQAVKRYYGMNPNGYAISERGYANFGDLMRDQCLRR